MSKNLFIVGTGTDVGKTYVSGLILKKLAQSGVRAAYYKAAMSGNDRGPDGRLLPGDALAVKEMSGIPQSLERMCPYVYQNAVSPHLAARMEGKPVELERVTAEFEALCRENDYVTMEGSGGILCPLRADGKTELFLPELIRTLGLGCLLVTDSGLGCINSVGLTAFYMADQGIPLRGILFNRFEKDNPLHLDNLDMCRRLTGAAVVARVGEGDRELNVSPQLLTSLYA